MPGDSYTPAGQQFMQAFNMAAYTNPFTLPERTAHAHVENAESRGNRGNHQRTTFISGPISMTIDSNGIQWWGGRPDHYEPPATMTVPRQQWDDRGVLIQKHERRHKDANKIINEMWIRLDPGFKVGPAMADAGFMDQVTKRAEVAYSDNLHMQNLFNQLAAYDILRDRQRIHPAPLNPAMNDEKRVNSLEATVGIQARLIREKDEEITRLKAAVSHSKSKNGDGAIHRLESQLGQANSTIKSLNKTINRLQKALGKMPVHKLPETAFGGVPENHSSLTFNGFSPENTFNPARLEMLKGPLNQIVPSNAMMPGNNSEGPKQSGANTAPLGRSRKRRHDSAMQSTRASPATTPMSTSSGFRPTRSANTGHATKHDHFDLVQRSDFGSKRAVPFLDYDDDANLLGPESPNKRVKSGALTPPLPEDLVMGNDSSGDGGVSIKYEEVDLEVGEIRDDDLPAPASPEEDKKDAFEDLDQIIFQAQKAAADQK